MSIPEPFRQPYLAIQNIPYHCEDASTKISHASGGVLRRGQAVWTEESYRPGHPVRSVRAFVETIGVVSLDPRWLVRASEASTTQPTTTSTGTLTSTTPTSPTAKPSPTPQEP